MDSSEYQEILSIFKAECDEHLQNLVNGLLARRLDFHLGDETIMAGHAKAEKDMLAVGLQSYKYVVVPQSLTWSASTFGLLKKFHDAGGRLLFCGEKPRFVSMKEPKVQVR